MATNLMLQFEDFDVSKNVNGTILSAFSYFSPLLQEDPQSQARANLDDERDTLGTDAPLLMPQKSMSLLSQALKSSDNAEAVKPQSPLTLAGARSSSQGSRASKPKGASVVRVHRHLHTTMSTLHAGNITV